MTDKHKRNNVVVVVVEGVQHVFFESYIDFFFFLFFSVWIFEKKLG